MRETRYCRLDVESRMPHEVIIVNKTEPTRTRAALVWGGISVLMTALVAALLTATNSNAGPNDLAVQAMMENVHPDIAQQLAQAKDASAVCLEKQGLTQQEIKQFASGTVCIGRKVTQHMGIGDPMKMAKNYLEARMNHKQLMTCLQSVDNKSAKAAHVCAKEMPVPVQKSPVVQFWLKNLAA